MKFIVFLTVLFTQKSESVDLGANLEGCATATQKAEVTDFFPDKLAPNHSETWNITYHGTYKVLTNKVVEERYLLYQCGTDPPAEEIKNTTKYKVVAPIPFSDGVALTSTVQIPMFELLGLRNEIKTYLGDAQYVSSPCLRKWIDEGTVEEYDPTVASTETLGAMLWSSQHPDRIIIDNQFMTSAGQGTDKTIIENGYKEGPPQAIFEWLYYYAVMYNKEKEAVRIATETEARYDCTKQNSQKMVNTGASKPVAVWAYFSNYPGWEGWLIGKCEPDYKYYCVYAEDCSMTLLHSDERMNDTSFEEFAKDADIFFYSYKDWDTLYPEKKEMLDRFKSVQNKEVYDTEGSGESTWWEQRMAEYDVVLEDFCVIAGHTTDLTPHQRHFMRNVFTEQVGQMAIDDTCNPSAPLVSRANECTLVTQQPGGNLGSGSPNGDGDKNNGSVKNSPVRFLIGMIFVLSFLI